jgi:hypothetical protein
MSNIEDVNDTLNSQTHSMKPHNYLPSIRPLRLEKKSLEGEVTNDGDVLVGILKGKVARLEEELQISHGTTARLQAQLEAQKSGYEKQIIQLKPQLKPRGRSTRNKLHS